MKYKVYIGFLNYQKIVAEADIVAEFCSKQRAEDYVEYCNADSSIYEIYWYEEA